MYALIEGTTYYKEYKNSPIFVNAGKLEIQATNKVNPVKVSITDTVNGSTLSIELSPSDLQFLSEVLARLQD